MEGYSVFCMSEKENKLKASLVNCQNKLLIWAALSTLNNLVGQYFLPRQTLNKEYIVEEH